MPRGAIEHFSRRRAEILEHMAERGERSARAAQIATLETRRRKEYGVPVDRLREEWRARAAEHGLDHVELRRVFRRALRGPLVYEQSHVGRRLVDRQSLTASGSTFTRRDVVQAVASAASQGDDVRAIEQQADELLAGQEVVALAVEQGERRYTTRSLLRTERELLGRGHAGRGRRAGLATDTAVRAALDARPTLSDEQKDVVRALTRRGDGVQIVLAAAGTGKTFSLDAASEAWRRSGLPVLGCAVSARAACELRDQTGVDATTIARLEHAVANGARLAERTVLIVDEAGMAGTRALATLATAVEGANGKLVLVGDDRQLPEIEAGGAFHALAQQLDAVEIRDVRRQRSSWDRDALAALRDGDVEQFARAYAEDGRLVATPNAEAARTALLDDWWAAWTSGADARMIAHRRSDVADLNARARRRMRETGRLSAGELSAGGREYAVGDRVVATRNAYRLGIVNGEAGVIAALDSEQLTLELDAGRRVRLPLAYVADGLDHGYAITAHRAQGATVDAAFVLGSDELYREWGYTALSRHRDIAHFYISARPAFLNDTPALLGTPDDVTRRVVEMLQGSRAQRLAIDNIEQPCRRARDPLEVPEVPNRSRRLTRQRGDADLGLER